jgi:hypothetical protein
MVVCLTDPCPQDAGSDGDAATGGGGATDRPLDTTPCGLAAETEHFADHTGEYRRDTTSRTLRGYGVLPRVCLDSVGHVLPLG